jgi:hypothetical protein
MEQLLKWDKGNDLWATVLIEPTPQPSALTEQYIINGVSSQIVDLIREFDQIFQEPSSLPPSRVYDHTIAITPNAAPINCRPYSPEQKNEIERQVAAMLKSGIVVPSLNPYASLVLLVKKKDNNW